MTNNTINASALLNQATEATEGTQVQDAAAQALMALFQGQTAPEPLALGNHLVTVKSLTPTQYPNSAPFLKAILLLDNGTEKTMRLDTTSKYKSISYFIEELVSTNLSLRGQLMNSIILPTGGTPALAIGKQLYISNVERPNKEGELTHYINIGKVKETIAPTVESLL